LSIILLPDAVHRQQQHCEAVMTASQMKQAAAESHLVSVLDRLRFAVFFFLNKSFSL